MEGRRTNRHFFYGDSPTSGYGLYDNVDDTSNSRERELLSGGGRSITGFHDQQWKDEYISTNNNTAEWNNTRKNIFDRVTPHQATRRCVAFTFDTLERERNGGKQNEYIFQTGPLVANAKVQMDTTYVNADNQRHLFRPYTCSDDQQMAHQSHPVVTLPSEEFRAAIDSSNRYSDGCTGVTSVSKLSSHSPQDEFLKRLHVNSNKTTTAAASSDVSLASITSSAASGIIRRELRNARLDDSGCVICTPSCELCSRLEARLAKRQNGCTSTHSAALVYVPAMTDCQRPTQKQIDEARSMLESRLTQDKKISTNGEHKYLTDGNLNPFKQAPPKEPCDTRVSRDVDCESSSAGETIRHRMYERTLRAPAGSFITCSEPSIHRRLC